MYTDEGSISIDKKNISSERVKLTFLLSGLWDLVGNNTPIFFVRDPFLVCIFNKLFF